MNRTLAAFAFAAVLLASLLSAQEAVNPVLRPPKGAQLAIVVFEDLQCPQCRREAPIVEQAGKTYKIPVIRHDFPLPMHNWSYEAAVIARYFDSQSKQLGTDFRDYIFEHQPEIFPTNLRQFAEKFAAEHKVDLPFVVDPQGRFAAEVNADRDLGKAIRLEHTPTVYVVSSNPRGRPFVEVQKPDQELFQTIDAMKAE
ncbi:MAG: thioredoxin domain-containing protein [Terriglobales bacterium]